MNYTIYDITKVWLIENGYDGLCNDDCGCTVDDFMPCQEPSMQCVAGHKVMEKHDFGDYIVRPGRRITHDTARD